MSKFHREFLEYHIVLGQGASLVREQELDAPKFLWDGGVSGDATGYVFVGGDTIGVENLSHV